MFNMQNELSSLEYGKGVTLTQRDSDFNTISTKGKVITDKSRGTKVFRQLLLRDYDKKKCYPHSLSAMIHFVPLR